MESQQQYSSTQDHRQRFSPWPCPIRCLCRHNHQRLHLQHFPLFGQENFKYSLHKSIGIILLIINEKIDLVTKSIFQKIYFFLLMMILSHICIFTFITFNPPYPHITDYTYNHVMTTLTILRIRSDWNHFIYIKQ